MSELKQLLKREDVQERFEKMLGDYAPSFLTSVINAVSNDTRLAAADKNSVLFAAATAAALQLPIDPNLGWAYIIPYSIKQDDGSYKTVAQFQIGYKGFIQLAHRSGQYVNIGAAPVLEGQITKFDPLFGNVYDFTVEGGKLIGYAAQFGLVNGFKKDKFMTLDELRKHGAKYSKSYNRKSGLWNTDFESMAMKTVLKLLLSKYAPLSIQMVTAIRADQSVVKDWDASDVEYIDNTKQDIPEKPELEALEAAKEELRVLDFIDRAKTLQELEDVDAFCETPRTKEALEKKIETLKSKQK